jgi:hypothetical protein
LIDRGRAELHHGRICSTFKSLAEQAGLLHTSNHRERTD